MGLVRALQPDFLRFLGVCLVISVAWLFATRVVPQAIHEVNTQVRQLINRIAVAFFVLAVVWFGSSAFLISTNILPRSDIERSGVYEQMNSLIHR